MAGAVFVGPDDDDDDDGGGRYCYRRASVLW